MLLSSILSDCPLGGAESEIGRSLESSGSYSADSVGVTNIVYYLSVQKNWIPPAHTQTQTNIPPNARSVRSYGGSLHRSEIPK